MRQHTGRHFWLTAFLVFFCAFSAAASAACDSTDSAPPEINFNAGQTVGYGDTVAVQIYASKPLCAPLQISYSIAGTATPIVDHDAVDDVVTLVDDKAAQIIFHTVAKPASGAPDKTIEFNLQTRPEWRAGGRATHVVVLSETIMKPRVSVLAQQNMDYAFLHQRVRQACSTCHDGINAVGKTPTHPATPAIFDCSTCHGSTTNFADSAQFVHPLVTSNCVSCHAADKPVTHFPVANNPDCSACHYITATTLSWTQASFDHATVADMRCDSCHSGVFAIGRTGNHLPIPPGIDCNACHNSTANFASNVVFNHNGQTSLCASCHNSSVALGRGPNHVPIPNGLDCGSCHDVPPSSFAQASFFTHTLVTSLRCDACHNSTFVAAANVPSLTHVAINGQDCSVCHNSAAWIPATPTTATLARALTAPELPSVLVDLSPRIGRVLARDQGKVALLAQVTSNTTHEYRYTWDTNSLGTANVVGKDTAWLTLDPSTLAAGSYRISVTVYEASFPERTSTTNVDVLVLDTLPALSETIDGDGDGIADAREGYGDEDDNGIAAFADPFIAGNVLPINAFTAGANVMHSTPGQKLALGTAAFAGQSNAATVSTAILLSNGTITADAANAVVDHTALDIRVAGVSVNDNLAEIVMPLAKPDSALKLLTRNGTWIQLDNSQPDLLAFATADAAGNCPNTISSAYQTTATATSHCIELRIQDNDDFDLTNDNNGEVRFIVAIGQPSATDSAKQPVIVENNDNGSNNGGGGNFGFVLSAFLAAAGFGRRWQSGKRREARSTPPKFNGRLRSVDDATA